MIKTKADAVILCITVSLMCILGIFTVSHGYDRIMFLAIIICAAVAASVVMCNITQLKSKIQHRVKTAAISSIAIGAAGGAIGFAADWTMSLEVFDGVTYPFLTGVIAGLAAMTKQLLAIKYRRNSEQPVCFKFPTDNIVVNDIWVSIADNITDEIINMRHERHLVQDKAAGYLDGGRDPIDSFKNDIGKSDDIFPIIYNRTTVGYILCTEDSETLYVKECYISEACTPHYLEMYVALKQFFELSPLGKTVDFKLPDDDEAVQERIEAQITEYFDECFYDLQDDGMHIIAENY